MFETGEIRCRFGPHSRHKEAKHLGQYFERFTREQPKAKLYFQIGCGAGPNTIVDLEDSVIKNMVDEETFTLRPQPIEFIVADKTRMFIKLCFNNEDEGYAISGFPATLKL